MTNNKIIDARGLSCPQPAMLTSQAIKNLGKGVVAVLVDSGTARDNVSRLAKHSGWMVAIEKTPGGDYRIVLTK